MAIEHIEVIHTLGPAGTNCEAAAHEWFRRQGRQGAVHLHPTLEVAVESLKDDPRIALLGCVAYPDLHTLVFSNLERFQMLDIFVMPTFNMILASRTGEPPATVATHPAPQNLAPAGAQLSFANSNAQAALDCHLGKTEGCVTTAKAARSLGLKTVRDFGPVAMGFTIPRHRMNAHRTAPARARPHRGARQENHPQGPTLALLDPMKTTQQDKTVQSLERQLNAFRQRQTFDGSIPDPTPQDIAALGRIQATGTLLHARYGQARMIGAWEQDIAAWLAAGLDTPPCFDRVRDAYQPPPNGLDGLFIGPVITANGPPPRGYHLEFFIARREDPPEVSDLEWTYPHPKNKCESARLLAASAGFMEGNCIVFFPENIRARDKVSHQQYALFFFNKFQKIYEEITLRNTTTFIGADLAEAWMGASRGMAPEDCYRARCVWGYLHDYYHHRGPMPLDTNLQLKLNWHAGLLEEIKVDSQVVLECLDPRIAYGASVIEFVLLERLFRYPLQVDVCRNFDSGTGVFLFEWLAEHGAIALDGGRITAFGREAIYGALRSLVETIEALERSARGDDYKALARQFVYRYLRPPSQEGDRFDIPPRMRAVLDAAHRPERELQFADLAY